MHDLRISVAVVVYSLFYTWTAPYSTGICMPYVQGGWIHVHLCIPTDNHRRKENVYQGMFCMG